jgi:hypothetical protein
MTVSELIEQLQFYEGDVLVTIDSQGVYEVLDIEQLPDNCTLINISTLE